MVSSEEELAVEVAGLDGIHVDLSLRSKARSSPAVSVGRTLRQVRVYSVNHGQPICDTVQPEQQLLS